MKNKLLTAAPLWFDGLLIVRLLTAFMILQPGMALFNEASMNDLKSFLSSFTLPFPAGIAYASKTIELAGAILLALGLFTRIISFMLIIVMIGVTGTMGGWDIRNDVSATLFGSLFLVFFLSGPGKWSLDYWLFDLRPNKVKN